MNITRNPSYIPIQNNTYFNNTDNMFDLYQWNISFPSNLVSCHVNQKYTNLNFKTIIQSVTYILLI